MALSVILALTIFLISSAFHIRVLNGTMALFPTKGAPDTRTLLLFLLAVLASHLVVAGIFAFGFGIGHAADLGAFAKQSSMQAMDYYYFSLINITTLGLGDIYPTGHLRFMAGIESLTGFLLISCSASYVFKLVRPDE